MAKKKEGWRKEHIQHLLLTNDRAVERALLRIYSLQTQYEKSTLQTEVHNNLGFTAFDSEFLSSVAERYKIYGVLSEKQREIVRRRMLKYWRQLVDIANESGYKPDFEPTVYPEGKEPKAKRTESQPVQQTLLEE